MHRLVKSSLLCTVLATSQTVFCNPDESNNGANTPITPPALATQNSPVTPPPAPAQPVAPGAIASAVNKAKADVKALAQKLNQTHTPPAASAQTNKGAAVTAGNSASAQGGQKPPTAANPTQSGNTPPANTGSGKPTPQPNPNPDLGKFDAWNTWLRANIKQFALQSSGVATSLVSLVLLKQGLSGAIEGASLKNNYDKKARRNGLIKAAGALVLGAAGIAMIFNADNILNYFAASKA